MSRAATWGIPIRTGVWGVPTRAATWGVPLRAATWELPAAASTGGYLTCGGVRLACGLTVLTVGS